MDNRYTRWITGGKYTHCERYVNRKKRPPAEGQSPEFSKSEIASAQEEHHKAEHQQEGRQPRQNQQHKLEDLHVEAVLQRLGRAGNDAGRAVDSGFGTAGGSVCGGQRRLCGVGVAQRGQCVGQGLPAHRDKAVVRLALDLLVVDCVGQILGQQVGRAAHGGGIVVLDLPAVARPHAVHVEQQLHAGILQQCVVDGVAKAGVGGVHRAEAQRDEAAGAVVVGQVRVVAAQRLGEVGVLRDLRADDDRVEVGMEILIAKFAQCAVVVDVEGGAHRLGVPGGVAGLPVVLLRQLLTVATPAAGDGQPVVDEVQRREQVAEVDVLAVGQRDGRHVLQRGYIGVAAVDIGLKFRVAGAGGQLPDRRVVAAYAGVGQRQLNGVGRVALAGGKLPRQRLQAGQPVDGGVVIIGVDGQRRAAKDRQQHNKHSQ